jgi:hypothetical protein
MWKVGEERTMLVGCNPESNFPISIELKFSVSKDRHHDAENSHGMWFGVEDAQRIIAQLEQAIETMRAAEKSVQSNDATTERYGRTIDDDRVYSTEATGATPRRR